jgi:hypothetical protein
MAVGCASLQVADGCGLRQTSRVIGPGTSRQELARTLSAAYADGLLSERTLAQRLDLLFGSQLIDPAGLVGDLSRRAPRREQASRLVRAVAAWARKLVLDDTEAMGPPVLLALDWSGVQEELLVGRHRSCDVVLSNEGVSRVHARLRFRDGSWVLQDLSSTNGTTVNGARVGRCKLRPGDRLVFGDEHVTID